MPRFVPGRLLAVEDDVDTQANLRDILEIDGYHLDAIGSISEASNVENWTDYSAIILDRNLPDGAAEDLLPQIRKSAPSAGILIITGHADLDGTIAALRHGVDDYILKPIDADALRASLIRIHKLREAREGLIQAERLAAIGQMVSGIAHESRNYLQKISASVESLQTMYSNDAEASVELDIIARSCDGLERLLDDLREYAGPIKLDRARWDIATVWRTAWKSIAAAHPEKEAALVEQPGSEDAWCSIDAFRMEQVFRNLFENALAACPAPVRLTVAHSNGAGDDYLRITVSDNGPGLPDDHPSRVFEPFFTTKTRGTGLGLSIVRRIIEAHGGRISAANVPSGGAAFSLEIPRKVGR